jgi:hypothetical protein
MLPPAKLGAIARAPMCASKTRAHPNDARAKGCTRQEKWSLSHCYGVCWCEAKGHRALPASPPKLPPWFPTELHVNMIFRKIPACAVLKKRRICPADGWFTPLFGPLPLASAASVSGWVAGNRIAKAARSYRLQPAGMPLV